MGKFFSAVRQIEPHESGTIPIAHELSHATGLERRIGLDDPAPGQPARVAIVVRHPNLQTGFFRRLDVFAHVFPSLFRFEVTLALHEQFDAANSGLGHFIHRHKRAVMITELDQAELGGRFCKFAGHLLPSIRIIRGFSFLGGGLTRASGQKQDGE